MTKMKGGRARMPWHGDISHTVLSNGRKVLRGSQDEARYKFGDEAVEWFGASMMDQRQRDAATAAIQGVIVASMNAIGVAVVGSSFKQIESSPISDDQIADMLNEIERGSGAQYNITARDTADVERELKRQLGQQ
jgi:hypothetical protein